VSGLSPVQGHVGRLSAEFVGIRRLIRDVAGNALTSSGVHLFVWAVAASLHHVGHVVILSAEERIGREVRRRV